ncbi:Uncharacterized conserved protein YndB, AHSA1/START domain [Jatrophihabitans endophyticus]|uniref:Uncharacterized conserved protein YndB, AHSA1/START domain n=1 Tax=Jatrophihabitans endophyticus TaxID=1206085 RepID=A0A1M5CLG6_9ACTN|nr:SRPBCC domain-containing protein [Jatrophihabitans endophyticus]SHF55541.1 Uncharacterized conserved protein YndB, AHSA1/START domain [Jatrophihabitans endophyticus]
MTRIHLVQDYDRPPETVWRVLTDPALVPRWTASGRGGRPEGFAPVVGTRFRFVGRPVPGWDGIVRCEVLAVEAPTVLRYSWRGGEDEAPSEVVYRLAATPTGTRFTYDHTGFTGVVGRLTARLVLQPVRRRMLAEGIPAVLATLTDDGRPLPAGPVPPVPPDDRPRTSG